MSERIAQLVSEARGWIGTPYVHQASVKGVGTDCLGLIRGLWRACLGAEPALVPPYTVDWAEAGRRDELLQAARLWLREKPLAAPSVGDVILFRMREGAVAKHVGFQSEVSPYPRFIHSYTGHGVVESPLSEPWARRIVARFEFPTGE
jgi:NlpC/P60 family putative phage cell wall peptidase